MSHFYIIDKNTRELIRESRTPFNVDETVQPPEPLIQLKRVINETRPPFDEATQKLEYFSTDDDVAFTRTFAYRVIAMTTEEIAAYQKQQADNAELEQLRAIYNDLKNGVGTATQRQVRVERCVAWLLKDYAQENFQ